MLKRALDIWAIKNHSYVKKIDFFDFCVYKNVFAKKSFLHINVNNNDYHQRNTTCPILYIKNQNKLPNVYTYIQKSRNFAKSKTICVMFLIYKKPDILCYTIFYVIFEIGGGGGTGNFQLKTIHFLLNFYMQKNSLSVTFLCTKIHTLCVIFLYAKNNGSIIVFHTSLCGLSIIALYYYH